MRRRVRSRKTLILTTILLSMLLASCQYLSVFVSKWQLSMIGKYDVIVVGSDPEGIAAALSSARNGLRTLLVDGRPKLGGLWTLGGLNFIDMNRDPNHHLLTRGIFEEFYNGINRFNFSGNKLESFDIESAESLFGRMVDREPNLVVKLGTPVECAEMRGATVVGVAIREDGVRKVIRAQRVIDATQDADIAASAGAPYYVGMEDFNLPHEWQPMTLIFQMSNVNWRELAQCVESSARKQTSRMEFGVTGACAWGFREEMQFYKSRHPNIWIRGMNIGRMSGDRVLINSLVIFGVNPLDKKAKDRAMRDAREELPGLARFICAHLPGFKRSRLIGAMPELYTRESRHIVGLYRLTVNDLLENRDFPDKIAMGSYPLDIQRTSVHNLGFVLGKPEAYSVPLRCLVPQKVENLLVVGRGASYDSMAHASTRVVPVGIATGQAAGVACYYSIRCRMPFRALPWSPEMRLIQDTLRRQGAYLEDVHYPVLCEGHWALPSVRFLRGIGVLAGGYENDYGLDDTVSSIRIINLTVKAEQRFFIWRAKTPVDRMKLDAVSKDQAGALMLSLAGYDYRRIKQPVKLLTRMGIIRKSTADRVLGMPKFTNAALYVMLEDYIKYRKNVAIRTVPLGPHIDQAGETRDEAHINTFPRAKPSNHGS